MKDLKNFRVDDYVAILWRRRWYVLLTAIIFGAAASAYIWRLPDIFRSETRIMVEAPFVTDEYMRTIARYSSEDRLNSIREQMASRTFLEHMVKQFQIGGYGSQPGFVMEVAVNSLRKRIKAERTSDKTFTLSFTATNPYFAQTITKYLADELIRTSKDTRKDRVLATDQFIDEQLRQSAKALSQQEEKLKTFKTRHIGELPEQSAANLNAINGLRSQLTTIETALQQARERERQLDFRMQERNRIDRLAQTITDSSIQRNDRSTEPPPPYEVELSARKAQLAALKAKYTEKHPDVDRLKQEVQELERQAAEKRALANSQAQAAAAATNKPEDVRTAKSADSSKNENRSKDSDQAEFQFEAASIKKEIDKRENERLEILQQIKVYQSRLNLAPELEQELNGLLHEADMLRQQYAGLQKQKFGSQIATDIETNKKNESFLIIDEANLPIKPESPDRQRLLLVGIIAAFALGIGAAVGRELLDSTISSEAEATAMLQLPVLVAIPEIPKARLSK